MPKSPALGEPTAMYTMGILLIADAHPERHLTIDPTSTSSQLRTRGPDLVRRAALAGDQDALIYMARHATRSGKAAIDAE